MRAHIKALRRLMHPELVDVPHDGRLRMLRLALLVMVLAGCGPIDGTTCETADSRRCDGATKVAYCEAGKWKSYDCPAGCAGDKCSSWKGAVAGQACPPAAGASWCDADGHVFLCSPNLTTTPVSARWTEGPCMACRKDVPLEQTGNCNASGACACQ